METDRITVTGEGRIAGWQDGATVARITWDDGYGECARECAREKQATAILWFIDQARECRLVSAELAPRVTPEDLMAAIAPGNRDVVLVDRTTYIERCTCADELLYTITTKSPDGTARTIGPISRTTHGDMVAGIVGDLRKENPGAEITVESSPNPDYRPDCLRNIAEDATYVKYVGAGGGSQDKLYCQRCAIAIWGE